MANNYYPFGSSYTVNQPSAMPMYAPVQQNNVYYWVQGEEGAKAYPVGAGNTVMLMDSENPVMYKKYADQTGRPILEVYDLVPRTTASVQNEGEFVRKDEIAAIVAEAVRNEMNSRKKNKEQRNG